MDEIKAAFSKKERNSEAMQAFGFRLRNQFSQCKAYRRQKELMWLEDLRAYKGIYDPEVKIEANNSKVYPKITRSKINIVLSRLSEMLFPAQDKNWEITPTPEPSMARETVKQIAMSLIQQPEVDPQTGQAAIDPQTGQASAAILPSVEDLQFAIKKYAEASCEHMTSVIDDQLTEMDYPEETKKVLRSGLMYGTGVMKGPMIGKRSKRLWQPTEDGKDYEEKVQEEEVPDLQAIRLWDWYPDMSVVDLDKMDGCFERHIMTKHDLRGLMKRNDFYPEMIEKYMEEHPSGDYVPENWETELQVIEEEAGAGRSGTHTGSAISTTETNMYRGGENEGTSRQIGKKYCLYEFWGYVDGSDLEACGINVDDVELEYAANVWLLGTKPVKAVLYPGALDQYKVFYYEKDETSIFGEGLARVMRHSQISIAAGARMILDNAAISSGPIVEMNWSLMTPGQDLNSLYPRMIIFREGKGVDAQYPAIREINIDCHVDELLKIVDLFKSFADEETTLPTWMIGQMVNNETAQATSGRMSMITVSIKDVVKNFDAFTEKIIRDLYAWNMDFNPRTDIKGDYAVKARGVSSLVMKEIRMQALSQLTTTLTPEEWAYIPKRDFLAEKLKAHDISIDLLSEEEVGKLQKAQEESVMNKLQVEMLQSEIAKNKAQSLSLLTKAKEHNVLATKEAQTPPETPESDDPRLADEDVALKQTDREAKMAQMRRDEERHMMDMSHADESHKTEMGMKTVKTAHEVAQKDKMAEHGMAMKEKMTEASAEAKKTAAKQKPKAAKPAKTTK